MHRKSRVLFLVIGSLALAGMLEAKPSIKARPYNLEAEISKDVLKLSFELPNQPALCHLKPVSMTLELPPERSAQRGIPVPPAGKITIKTETAKICLAALGPHRGAVELSLKGELPSLEDGYYELDIDSSTKSKYLHIADHEVEIVSQLPQ